MAYGSCKIEGPHGTIEFGVTQLPNRKRPCLYRMRGAMLEPLAYFRCDQDADVFDRIIDAIVEAFNGG